MTQNATRFSQVPRAEISRSSFDRSHGLKTTLDAGDLIPILVDEALPGDTFNCKLSAFGRMSTPINPLMDNIYMNTFFFAVPNRLIWENWQRFNGEQDNPTDSIDFVVPQITGTFSNQSLGDYFGIPYTSEDISISALPFRAYQLIWNEFFRDQNLQDSVVISKADGGDLIETTYKRKRGKRHDYFTSCLPFPQKGEEVLLPLGTSAPVLPNGPEAPTFQDGTQTAQSLQGQSGDALVYMGAGGAGSDGTWTWEDPNLFADLTGATSATINELREAFAIQRMQERDARGGTRYTEILKAHFGVTSPDARLQRPEYLGGGQSMVNINPVPQTSGSPGDTDYTPTVQGNLAGYGTVSAQGHGFTKSFTEHCQIIGLVSFRADLTYQQGLDRMWSRQTRYDYFWPALQHLGEQAVLNKEIYINGLSNDENTFGYQERYAEYRFKSSNITGRFRSAATAPLDSWHLAQDFAARPVLNEEFITENPPIDRVIAVPEEPHFILDCYFNYQCARPMAVYGVPGMIDHF